MSRGIWTRNKDIMEGIVLTSARAVPATVVVVEEVPVTAALEVERDPLQGDSSSLDPLCKQMLLTSGADPLLQLPHLGEEQI
ncbi:hypothetical protein PR202_ga30466 [Eleusine coracana subsp. coracana]|nr:hypothetical protein PR202_ga30466 [Eleusine coracana subsp. coracana]